MNSSHATERRNGIVLCLLALLSTLLSACGSDAGTYSAASDDAASTVTVAQTPAVRPPLRAAAPATSAIQNPILFVTQVPTPGGDAFASRMSTFANHQPRVSSVVRGGDLMIRYPDGSLRNLTREAGYGMDGQQGDNAIAVREPTVHWSGNKAVFSMVVGAPPRQYVENSTRWQLYEVSGLAQGQTAVITRVPNQPTAYNNVSPLYASDDRILFMSDRPIGGAAHLYPQLDEYESTPTLTGIYSLDPASGALKMLNHTPSGAFSPTIDSFGRLIFVRWDHLQRDQQADAGTFGAVNYDSEAANATKLATSAETFPEPRQASNSAYGPVAGFTYNLFTPWQMNQDGTDELSLNHIGRHEMSFGYLPRSFTGDSALQDFTNQSFIANRKYIRNDGGVFHVREDPATPGTYYAVYAREFGSMTSSQLVRFTGSPGLNAEQMTFEDASPAETANGLPGGRFRNPLPMRGGQLVASYTASPTVGNGIQFRLHQLVADGTGMLQAGAALTPGISKSVSWWSPDAALSYNGPLWEIEPVEVVARQRPESPLSRLETPERSVLAEERVEEQTLRGWMKLNNLALIVTRNQTSRDRGDLQQPFNLQVPAGVKTTSGNGRVYDIAHYQVFQGNAVRAYDNFGAGRRLIAQPMGNANNPANPSGPPGSAKIAGDGSTAMFVPANRALTWQTTDGNGVPIVRERVWITLQPGEIRTCAGCHGQNSVNQAGQATPVNKPEALRALLRHWLQNTMTQANGSRPRTRPRTTSPPPSPSSIPIGQAATRQPGTRLQAYREPRAQRR